VQALQRRDYDRAAEIFRTVLDRYPDERELHERVRLYLKVCERQLEQRPSEPRTIEERVYAATVALNAGAPERALEYLRAVLAEDAGNDHAHYMTAVALTQRGDLPAALGHLHRSIELNPENRNLARQDPDLEPARETDAFRQALDAGGQFVGRRRRSRR
jgi:tetratricopeptide (TPR) repeat protein